MRLAFLRQRAVRWALLPLATLILTSCSGSGDADGPPEGSYRILATTSIVGDLVATLGEPHVSVQVLMAPSVDPHTYVVSEGDVGRMSGADAVVYSGLHLEGKMGDVFEGMARRGKTTFAVAEQLDPTRLIAHPDYADAYDPHVWLSVPLWLETAQHTTEFLKSVLPQHADAFDARLASLAFSMDSLDAWIRDTLRVVAPEHRLLVTSHDAFQYFGRTYGFEVMGLQGISTATEAGTADVRLVTDIVVSRRLPAIFIESSVWPRGIEAVQAATEARGHQVRIGGTLYSDALGGPDSGADTYLSMISSNVRTLAQQLSQP
jgi:manganese/zinc/iron transport system substrate-binding protein